MVMSYLLFERTDNGTGQTTTLPLTENHTTEEGPIFIRTFAQSEWMYVYLVLNAVLGLLSVFLNSVVFSFYLGHIMSGKNNNQRNRVYYFLYMMLSLADLARGITALAHALILGFVIDYTPRVIEPLGYLILALSSLSGHLSVLLNVLISLLRTVHILTPTLRIIPHLVMVPLYVYGLLWGTLSAVDIVEIKRLNIAAKSDHILLYVLIAPRIYCMFDEFVRAQRWYEYAVIAIGLPYILPTIVCVVCAVVQVVSLLNLSIRTRVNERITVTIITLTVCFFLCNTPYFLYFCLSIKSWSHVGFIARPETIFSYFVANFPGTINSVMNPVILLSRGRSLRRHIVSGLPCFSGTVDTVRGRPMTGQVYSNTYITSRPDIRVREPVSMSRDLTMVTRDVTMVTRDRTMVTRNNGHINNETTVI